MELFFLDVDDPALGAPPPRPAALVSLRSGAAGLEAFRVSQKSSEQRAGSADAAAGAAEGRV